MTTYFTTAIVQTVFVPVGTEPADYRAEAVYWIRTEDDLPRGMETAMLSWLDEHGVDAAALATDFVSTRTMYRYLRTERGLDIQLRLHHPPHIAERHDITAEDLEARIEAAFDPGHVDRLAFIRQLYGGTTVPEAVDAVGYEPSTG